MDFLKRTLLVLGFVACTSSFAFALPVNFGANTQYLTSPGSVYVVFLTGSGGENYRLDFDMSGTYDTGNISSNVFDTVTVDTNLTSTVATNLDTNAAVQFALTGTLDFNYADVNVSGDGTDIAQIGTDVSAQSGTLVLNGTLDNRAFSANIALGAMPAAKSITDNGGFFSPLVNSFDGLDGATDSNLTFSFGAWDSSATSTSVIGWHMAKNAAVTWGGVGATVSLSNDIHGNVEVPEPATAALLLSGLLGGGVARRKRKSA